MSVAGAGAVAAQVAAGGGADSVKTAGSGVKYSSTGAGCVRHSLRAGIGTTSSVPRVVAHRGHLHTEREFLVSEKCA